MRFAMDDGSSPPPRVTAEMVACGTTKLRKERAVCIVLAVLTIVGAEPAQLRAQDRQGEAPKKGAPPERRGRIDSKGGGNEGSERPTGNSERGNSKTESSRDSFDPASRRSDGPDCPGDEEAQLREGYRAAFEGTRDAFWLLIPLLVAAGLAVLVVVYLNRRTVDLGRRKRDLPAVEPDKNDKGEYVID